MRSASVAVAVLIAACARASTPAATPAATGPEQSSVGVQLSGASTADALERVKAAFVAEGLAVAEASSAGVVTSAPAVPVGHAIASGEYVYRATVVADGAVSRVFVTGAVRNRDASARGERTLTSHWRSLGAKHGYHGWTKVERLATRIGGDAP